MSWSTDRRSTLSWFRQADQLEDSGVQLSQDVWEVLNTLAFNYGIYFAKLKDFWTAKQFVDYALASATKVSFLLSSDLLSLFYPTD